MSNYEWARGEITLPAAAVTSVKKAVRDAHNKRAEKVYELCKKFWANHATQSRDAYEKRVRTFVDQIHDSSAFRIDYAARGLTDDIYSALNRLAGDAQREERNPRGDTWDDLDRFGFGRKTNRATEFQTVEGGSIIFGDRVVHVDCPENNHAVDYWQEDPVVKALLAALSRVDWTRNSGGVVWYGSEYMGGPDNPGMPASSAWRTFGPNGKRRTASTW